MTARRAGENHAETCDDIVRQLRDADHGSAAEKAASMIEDLQSALLELWMKSDPDDWNDEFVAEVRNLLR